MTTTPECVIEAWKRAAYLGCKVPQPKEKQSCWRITGWMPKNPDEVSEWTTYDEASRPAGITPFFDTGEANHA